MKFLTPARPFFLMLVGMLALETQFAARSQSAVPAGETSSQELPGQPGEPTLKPNPLETLRNFQPADNEEYRLGKATRSRSISRAVPTLRPNSSSVRMAALPCR